MKEKFNYSVLFINWEKKNQKPFLNKNKIIINNQSKGIRHIEHSFNVQIDTSLWKVIIL